MTWGAGRLPHPTSEVFSPLGVHVSAQSRLTSRIVATIASLGVIAHLGVTVGAAGLFSSRAVRIDHREVSESSDRSLSVSVVGVDDDSVDGFPAIVRVRVGETPLERPFRFGLNTRIPWSPDRSRFAIAGGAGGAGGQFRTAVVTVRRNPSNGFEVTGAVERAFGDPVVLGYPEHRNVGAITWLSDTELLVAGQVMRHCNCDSAGTFGAYRIGTTSVRVERKDGQFQVKRRRRAPLHVDLAGAAGECVLDSRCCYVPGNHPER